MIVNNRNNFLVALLCLVVVGGPSVHAIAEIPSYEDLAHADHEQRHTRFAILMGERLGLLAQCLRNTYTKKLSLPEAQYLLTAVQDFVANLEAMVTCAMGTRDDAQQCCSSLQEHLQKLEAFEAQLRYQWTYIATRMHLMGKFQEREEVLGCIEQAHYCFCGALGKIKRTVEMSR